MPRPLRIEYEGAIYHVMNRGDRREPIFLDERDRETFLRTLHEACEKTGWQVHAYVLMDNHFHLVVETPQPNLCVGMKWLLGTYTMRYNRRHGHGGHLFGGRYKAQMVDGRDARYLLTVCDYVHLNPVRARMVKPKDGLETYRWSSYPAYLRPKLRPPWLRVDRLLGEHRLAEKSRQALAERLVRKRLRRLHINESLLGKTPKGDRRNVEIAREVRRQTPMPRTWIAQRLKMGSASYLSTLLSRSVENKNRPLFWHAS